MLLTLLCVSFFIFYFGINKNNHYVRGEEVKDLKPKMRLYRMNHVTKKGDIPIPEELTSDPKQTGQIIDYNFGHSPNCEQAPLERSAELLDTEWFCPQVESILILHDRCGSASDVWVAGILEALRMREFWKNYNIMALDFPGFMCEMKDKIQDMVGMKTDFEEGSLHLKNFLEGGVSSGKIHLDQVNIIGLGMGASLAGSVARAVNSGGSRVKSIVGLNPSTFQDTPPVCKDDARLVQLLHTYSPEYGTTARVGTADFVFNGADDIQYICQYKGADCSHTMSFKIFTAVIVFTSRFQVWRCPSWRDFVLDGSKCDQDYGYIYYPPDETLQGTYFIRVGCYFPYGLGEDGNRFDDRTVGMEIVPGYKPKINKRPSSAI